MKTYFENEQDLSSLLKQAAEQGAVRIRRQDGQTFLLRPENGKRSALDVPRVDLGISTKEIVEFIHEGRKRF